MPIWKEPKSDDIEILLEYAACIKGIVDDVTYSIDYVDSDLEYTDIAQVSKSQFIDWPVSLDIDTPFLLVGYMR